MRRGRRRKQNIQQALFRVEFGFIGNILQLFGANVVNRNLDQVADHGFHIAANVADFRKLRSFDFEERRIRQLRQAAGDFCLPHACRPDHDDVLGNDFFCHIRWQLLPAHAVAQSNGNGTFRVLLPDNVLVELDNDLARRQLVES